MKKAFDSVSLKALQKALERIRLPETTINLILNLFKNRQSRIITDLGPTNFFKIQEGIEQGEVISPLIWRMFYDPLLERIQEDPKLGYTMDHSKRPNPSLGLAANHSWRQAVVAFADDTTWIAKDKDQMEAILSIAEEFFRINDIQINGKKTKLITMNSSNKSENKRVFFGGEWIYEEKETKILRFLGIWLNSKMKETAIKTKAKEIIHTTTKSLFTKK